MLDRHDIRAAAARAVAEVEQWIAKRHPARPVGRPPKTEGDENLGRRPTFSAGDGGSGEAADAVSAEELRDIRRAHPDPEDDAALQARMQRIEAAGKVVSRRSLREQVRRERQGASAEPAAQDAPSAEPPMDGACAPSAPADAAAAPLHACAVEALREQVEEDSIDAVAVALHRADEALIAEVLGFGEWAVRPGGLVLVQCRAGRTRSGHLVAAGAGGADRRSGRQPERRAADVPLLHGQGSLREQGPGALPRAVRPATAAQDVRADREGA